MTSEKEHIDHMGKDVEFPTDLHCQRCGIKLNSIKEIGFATDDDAVCQRCFEILEEQQHNIEED